MTIKKYFGPGIVRKKMARLRSGLRRPAFVGLCFLFLLPVLLPVGVVAAAAPSPDTSSSQTSNPSATTSTSTNQLQQSSQGQELDDDCNKQVGWGLSWAVCPVFMGLVGAADNLNSLIDNLLVVPTGTIFNNSTSAAQNCKTDNASQCSTSDDFYAAWSDFRDIALALVVVVALIMIISQALGFELVSAYTIRKVLPRLLFAVVFITLSWSLLDLVIQFSNDVGTSLMNIIWDPFKNLPASAIPGAASAQSAIGNTSGVFVGILLAIASGAFDGFVLFLMIIPVILGALIAFGVLVFRQILIIFLIITAPVAIACYILPNTHRGWEIWRDTLISVLIVFPIISALIGAGRAFADISLATSAGNVGTIMAIIAYVAPYFLVVTAFKMAGGVLASVHGVATNAHQGVFGSLNKSRQERRGKVFSELNKGTYRGVPGIDNVGNYVGKHAGAGVRGRFGYGKRGQEAMDQSTRMAAASDIAKKGAGIMDDDEGLRAATYENSGAAFVGLTERYKAKGKSSADAQEAARRAINSTQASIGFGHAQQLWAAQQMAATGTAYEDTKDVATTINRASRGNNSTIENLSGYINNVHKAKGRWEAAPGAGDLAKLSTNAPKLTQPDWDNATLKSLATSGDPGSQYRSAKKKVFENMNEVYKRVEAMPDATPSQKVAKEDMRLQIGARIAEAKQEQFATGNMEGADIINGMLNNVNFGKFYSDNKALIESKARLYDRGTGLGGVFGPGAFPGGTPGSTPGGSGTPGVPSSGGTP